MAIKTKEDVQSKVYEIMAEVTEINADLSKTETLSPLLSANIYNNLCPILKDLRTVKNTVKYLVTNN